jgi:hypothetical protein
MALRGARLSPRLAAALSFVLPALSPGIYTAIALVWLIPDRRIERVLRP